MAAVLLRFRSELRSRWRAWLALALMFGVASGATIAAAAGARRTETAYPRFLRAQDGFHALTGGGAEGRFEEAYASIKALPMVRDFAELVIVGGGATMPAKPGHPGQEVSFPEVIVISDPSGRALYRTNRAKVLRGRLADRDVVDETTVPFSLAERYGLELGDRVTVGIGFNLDRFPEPLEQVALEIVGIVAAPGDFEAVGQPSFLSLYATPALFRTYRSKILDANPETWNLGVHLRGGPGAAVAFKQLVERTYHLDVPIIEPVVRSGVQKTMRLYSAALWLVAALIAAATVTVLGQTLARQQTLDATDFPVLRAFGVSRGQLTTLGMLRAGSMGVVAAVTAIGVAYLLSPLTPIGTARIAEPSPGFAFDAAALWLGAATTLLLLPLLASFPVIRAARAASREARAPFSGDAQPSWIARAAGSSRSPAAATGLRMALEPGRGRTAVPVRSTILAVALGVAALTGALVVGRSLSHLISTPALAGFTYDAIIPNESELADAQRAEQLRAFPFIAQMTRGTGLNAVFEGVDSFIVGFEQDNPINFAIISGRSPTDADNRGPPEIALGPTTMRRLGLDLGDATEFRYAAPEGDANVVRSSGRVRVVGVAAIPPLPWAAIEPGEGAVMTIDALARVSPHGQGGCCFVRFKPGTDLAAAKKALDAAGFEAFLRTKRTDLATLERISRLPLFLSLIFATIAAAALAHVLITGIRRRRRDLAILKTLGFVKRQVRAAVAWQASAVALLSAAVGIPAGVALGRWGWRLVASQFGVVPASVAPLLLLGLLIPAALLLANVVAAIPGRVAARTQPATVLRTE